MERDDQEGKCRKTIIRGNKVLHLLVFLLCLTVLAGCGKKEEDNDYYIVETESEQVFTRTRNDANTFLLGNRFYLGEAVQLAGYLAQDGTKMDVYLCRTSGGEELLWEGVPKEYRNSGWYLDDEGNGYCIYGNEMVRYDKGGGERYRREQEGIKGIVDVCVSGDGAIMLLGRTADNMVKLMEADRDTGELTDTGAVLAAGVIESQAGIYIGGNNKTGFLLLDSEGIWEADMEEGRRECVMEFGGGSYLPEAVADFQVLEDGTAQILRGGEMDTLRPVNISEVRTVLVLRVQDEESLYSSLSWLFESIACFNRENGEYYVIVEDRGEEDSIAFRERTDMELALGTGPDMVLSLVDNPLALIEKGALENLVPYMEASGMSEEDYFPAAFGCWGDVVEEDSEIYCVNIAFALTPGMWADAGLLPDGGATDLAGVVDALENYQGEAIWSKTSRGKNVVLRMLLQASDSLGGMVDWEKGTCNFTDGFFGSLLELNKRYAYREGDDIAVLTGSVAYSLYLYGNIYGNDEEMAGRGMVRLDYLFDDAHCAAVDGYNTLMAVSSASAHKEGAWELIRFLLSEEEQSKISWVKSDRVYPVNRKAFDMMASREIAEGGVIAYYTGKDGRTGGTDRMASIDPDMSMAERIERYALTEEKIARVRDMLENARALPLRTEPILQIIYEEADAYYSGDRSVEDVCGNIQNRVQLYLNENR